MSCAPYASAAPLTAHSTRVGRYHHARLSVPPVAYCIRTSRRALPYAMPVPDSAYGDVGGHHHALCQYRTWRMGP
eukprot:3510911-Rhodomonas_salina.6